VREAIFLSAASGKKNGAALLDADAFTGRYGQGELRRSGTIQICVGKTKRELNSGTA